MQYKLILGLLIGFQLTGMLLAADAYRYESLKDFGRLKLERCVTLWDGGSVLVAFSNERGEDLLVVLRHPKAGSPVGDPVAIDLRWQGDSHSEWISLSRDPDLRAQLLALLKELTANRPESLREDDLENVKSLVDVVSEQSLSWEDVRYKFRTSDWERLERALTD